MFIAFMKTRQEMENDMVSGNNQTTKVRMLTNALFVTGVALMSMSGPPAAADESETLLLTEFTPDTPELDWYVQNDNVMGGRSEGGFAVEDNRLNFTGSTNTNGGGFSSIRTTRFKLDLSKYQGIRLRLKADGRRYTWQINTNAKRSGYPVSYWAEFDTPDGEWAEIDIPFGQFYPQFRGYKLDGPELDPGDITEFGLYIYDKKDGPFELILDRIEAY